MPNNAVSLHESDSEMRKHLSGDIIIDAKLHDLIFISLLREKPTVRASAFRASFV